MSADMTMVIGVTNPSSAVVALAVHLCAFAANACVNVFFGRVHAAYITGRTR